MDGHGKTAAGWWRFWLSHAEEDCPELEIALWRWKYMAGISGCHWVNFLSFENALHVPIDEQMGAIEMSLKSEFRTLGLDVSGFKNMIRLERDDLLPPAGWTSWKDWGQTTDKAGVIEPPQLTWARMGASLAIGDESEREM